MLSVVTLGLYLGRRGPRVIGSATRVQAEAMWTMIQFLLESMTFILVGLELPVVLLALHGRSIGRLIGFGALITATVIAVRLLYTGVAASLLRWVGRRHGGGGPRWSEAAFLGWTGLRGGDSLVIALALPLTTAAGTPFPARDLILFLTFVVIFSTLVLQGLTLGPLLRRLGLREDDAGGAEEAHARRVVAEAGLQSLDRQAGSDDGEPVLRALRSRHADRVRRWAARDRQAHGANDGDHRTLSADDDGSEKRADRHQALRRAMIGAERAALVDLRDGGTIGDDVMRRVQRELDLETMMLDSAKDDASEPYDEA